jgi:ribonuclease Z
MIHDATFLDGQESIADITKHSTARDAGSIAKLAGARRLALTHISPTNEGSDRKYVAQASSTFKGQVIAAKDNQMIQV